MAGLNGVQHVHGDELTDPRQLADWMSQRGLLASRAKITAAMFDTALQLRTGVRARLQCDPVERRRNSDALHGLDKVTRLFPLVAEAQGRPRHGVARRAQQCAGRIVGGGRRTV